MGEGFVLDDRNIKINFIAKTQPTQVYHTCEKCSQPIISYGRMIPCKHIFCFTCACQTRETDQNCARCHDPVQRIEKCPRGAVFVCRIPLCRRTYLSQRDLTAHIRHRHKANEAHAQGLQVEIPGTDGGTPAAPPAAPPAATPVVTPPTPAPTPQPIHSGQSGWSPQASGVTNYSHDYRYNERDRTPTAGRGGKAPQGPQFYQQRGPEKPAAARGGSRGGFQERRGGFSDQNAGRNQAISQGQWGAHR